jgi:GTPase-associated protein 1, N-terminal domain type 2/GTPase-associated protein 1, middle domain
VTRRRFGQLTYTSVDPQDGTPGGWQVKQQSADLLPDELTLAMGVLSTDLQPVSTPSAFPSAQEIETMPRRMVFHVGHGKTSVLAHAVSAGPDASGRPGNVFNHAIVDREVGAALSRPDPVRPIQAWGSKDWRTPYGPELVRLDKFDDDEDAGPRPGSIDLAAVCTFLGASDSRLDGLGALLDACRAALESGTQVVLVADDVDSGAMWLASIAFLATPQTSPRLTFNTYVRATDLSGGHLNSLLSVVLRADLDKAFPLPHSDWLLLDPKNQAPALNGRWTSFEGAEFEVSPWSQLFAAAAESQEGLASHLGAADALSLGNPDSADASPYWSLAVSLATVEASVDVHDVAMAVIDQETEQSEQLGDASRVLRCLLEEQTEPGTEAAWDAAQAGGRSLLALVRDVVYLGRALADDNWLLDPATRTLLPRSPQPDKESHNQRRRALLERDVERRLTNLAQPPTEPSSSWCMGALRTFEFLVLLGVPFADDRSESILLRVTRLLRGPNGVDIAEFTGKLCAQVADAVLGAFPKTATGAEPWAISAPVVAEWLLEGKNDEDVARVLQLDPKNPVYGAAAAFRCRRGYHPRLREAAALHLLKWRDVRTRDDADIALALIESVSAGEPWTTMTLLPLLDADPGDIARTAAVLVLATPPSRMPMAQRPHEPAEEPGCRPELFPPADLAESTAVHLGLRFLEKSQLGLATRDRLGRSVLAGAVQLVCVAPDPKSAMDAAARESLDGPAGRALVRDGLAAGLLPASVPQQLADAAVERLTLEEARRRAELPEAYDGCIGDAGQIRPSQLLLKLVLQRHLAQAQEYAAQLHTQLHKLHLSPEDPEPALKPGITKSTPCLDSDLGEPTWR